MTVIWVANRENPINDSSGVLQISQDGNLVISDGQNSVVWSSNISTYVANSSAQILDTGNLVLDNSNGGIIWESFLHAFDLFVEGMIQALGGLHWVLSRHRHRKPSFGKMDILIGEVALEWSGLNASGIFLEKKWSDKIWNWEVKWTSQSEYDLYGKCGNFGFYYAAGEPMCSCFPGFDPRSEHEWDEGNWTSGCTKTMMQCGRKIFGEKEDVFLKMSGVKLPDK
ncbi:hypothetical protein BUALT_Bualt18G0104900 [Buddleja alternifolia]|uniref:Bulb-type lectin domain-containing protein n=1 Tax=Buddleja alternifolia TaxID=168488 RepID=A0AAV6WEV2_9LAMI|nr:hypothetical protein BUALT_Bualt18G0103900 [Buddleja alternifolia]KAG8365438.1 hypothetical protein BUALT_Bualt18G0104900 [Buddleja alternifolia]